MFVLPTTGTGEPVLVSSTPVFPPAFWPPPPPLPFACASSRAYRCRPLMFVWLPGTADSRVCISTVSEAGSVTYVVTSR